MKSTDAMGGRMAVRPPPDANFSRFLGTWRGRGRGEWHGEEFDYVESVVWRALPTGRAFYVESVARIDGEVSHADLTLIAPKPRGRYAVRVLDLNGAIEHGAGRFRRPAFTWKTKIAENRPKHWPIDHVLRRHTIVNGGLRAESWLALGSRFLNVAHTNGTLQRRRS